MKIIHNLSDLKDQRRVACLAIGVFDGVHRGHREVIARTVRYARAHGGKAWILTFDGHPARALDPASAPSLITSTEHKLRLLARLRVDGCLLIRFTPAFARLKPEAFLSRLWGAAPALRSIFVGGNWRFGRGGKGNPRLLERLARPRGVRVNVVPPVRRNGRVISSTRIRRCVWLGRIEEASGLLGRRFSVLGTVVPGRGIGRSLGFPTANIEPHGEVLPPPGVYAVFARIGGRTRKSVVYVGSRPTFESPRAPVVLEVHVLGLRDRLYGRRIEVFFVSRLRGDRTFASLTALARQIRRDVERARSVLTRA